MKTKIDVSFYNSGSDFRETAYPTIELATSDQIKKLHRDIKSAIGADGYELLKVLLNE